MNGRWINRCSMGVACGLICTFPRQVIHGFALRLGIMEPCTITERRASGVTWIGFSSTIYTLSDSKKNPGIENHWERLQEIR